MERWWELAGGGGGGRSLGSTEALLAHSPCPLVLLGFACSCHLQEHNQQPHSSSQMQLECKASKSVVHRGHKAFACNDKQILSPVPLVLIGVSTFSHRGCVNEPDPEMLCPLELRYAHGEVGQITPTPESLASLTHSRFIVFSYDYAPPLCGVNSLAARHICSAVAPDTAIRPRDTLHRICSKMFWAIVLQTLRCRKRTVDWGFRGL